jgi:hypothetical protein
LQAIVCLAGSSPTSVKLNNVEVRQIISANDSLAVVVADGAPAASNTVVQLEANTGALTTAVGWRYIAPTTISSVSPASGQTGTRVTIEGSNLLGGASALDAVVLLA